MGSGRISFWSNVRSDLSIISIPTSGSGDRRRDRNAEACQDPGSLTRGEARCEQSVVDLARDGKAVTGRNSRVLSGKPSEGVSMSPSWHLRGNRDEDPVCRLVSH